MLDCFTCEAGAGLVEVVGEGAVEAVVLAVLGGHPRRKLARLVVVANCKFDWKEKFETTSTGMEVRYMHVFLYPVFATFWTVSSIIHPYPAVRHIQSTLMFAFQMGLHTIIEAISYLDTGLEKQ